MIDFQLARKHVLILCDDSTSLSHAACEFLAACKAQLTVASTRPDAYADLVDGICQRTGADIALFPYTMSSPPEEQITGWLGATQAIDGWAYFSGNSFIESSAWDSFGAQSRLFKAIATRSPTAGSRFVYIASPGRLSVDDTAVCNRRTASLLIHSLVRSFAHKRISANAVVPGLIAGPELALSEAQWAKYGDTLDEKSLRQRLQRHIPVGRYGQPGEVASLIGFLLSPHSTYLTGAVIDCDGGWNAATKMGLAV